MSDLIERQKAIDAMAQALWLYPNEYYRNLSAYAFAKGLAENGLRSVPSAQTAPQWIPCSEMEPKKSGRYLCTHSGTGIVSPDYYTTQEQAEELFADPEDEYLDLEDYVGWESQNVIAWMPLPEPYRAERRTDE